MKTPPSPPRDQAVHWLLRLRADDCTLAERRAFEDWRAESPEHARLYRRLEAQWDGMERLKTRPFPAREEALRYRVPPRRRRRRNLGLAAAAALLLALGFTAFGPRGWLGSSETYVAERGKPRSFTLADGSRIELNTDTQLKVHFDRWTRRVELERGEAFFTVAHQDGRPFEVQAGAGRIRDLGTAFEVYRQPERVLVAVQEGRVEVSAAGKRELAAGQRLAYGGDGAFLPEPAEDLAGLTAWRQGRLVFHARRLDDVLDEVSRYHEVRVRARGAGLNALRVTGVFRTADLDAILNTLAATLPVRVQRLGAREILLESVAAKPR